MNMSEWIFKELSYEIVGTAMDVHNELGVGFLEKVYKNALAIALHERGIERRQQAPLKVKFHNTVVGGYFADILVEEKIILELKVAESIADIHQSQALNYLRATGLKLAIIFNFAKPRLESKRIVL
jgi:GxxExxY protein